MFCIHIYDESGTEVDTVDFYGDTYEEAVKIAESLICCHEGWTYWIT